MNTGELESNIVKDDEILDELSSYPDRFFDLLSSNPVMLKDYLENRNGFFVINVHPSLIRNDRPDPFPEISLRSMFRANFIMVNGKILKNRWGGRD